MRKNNKSTQSLCESSESSLNLVYLINILFCMWRLQVNSSICRTYTVNRCRRQLSLVSNAQTPLFLFCSLAVLDPRVGHTMDVLSPFIPVLCPPLLPVIVDLSLARTNSQQIEVMEFEQKCLRPTTGLDSEEN